MSHSIMRLSKMKGFADINGIMKHIERMTDNYSNIDIDKTKIHLNYSLLNFQQEDYNKRINQRLEEGYNGKRKIRSDAIRLVDGLITSDKKFFEGMSDDQVKQFFQDGLEFIQTEFGEENVAYATVHLDEETPHMHIGFVPLTEDGRLSAKEMLGNKTNLSVLQDRFHTFVNERGYEMKRGESSYKTKRKHKEMNDYKLQTAYHKKELEKVQADYISSLAKWEKAEKLHILKENKEYQTLNLIEGVPGVDVKQKMFGRVEIDPQQVDKLKEYTNKLMKLATKQQDSLARKDNTIKNLNDLIKEQERDQERLVQEKSDKEKEKLKKENSELSNLNYELKSNNDRLIYNNQGYWVENNDLKEENDTLKKENFSLKAWKDLTVHFMKQQNIYRKFVNFYKKIRGKDTGYER